MDSIVSVNIERALESYIETTDPVQRKQLRHFSGYQFSQQWQQQPQAIRDHYAEPDSLGRLYVYKDTPFPFKPNEIDFLIALEMQGERYFISRHATLENASPLIGQNARASQQLLLGTSITIAVVIILIIMILMRYISRPVSRLSQWTHQLNPQQLKQPPPDFSYPELNDMAQLIQGALSSVQDTFEREQNFLRFTSHELRTPITVIRNNIELIRKLEAQQSLSEHPKFIDIIDRIDRASLTMQQLSETLLWLSRDDLDSLPVSTFRLDKLIEELVENLHYLLNQKAVTIHLDTQPYDLTLAKTACQIVIANLIRNAFQHTWEGEVHIQQRGDEVNITNHCSQFEADQKSSDQGFGLGLRLTAELCEKLHWHYDNHPQTDGHIVSLSLTPPHSIDKTD
jgi:signal transduction histidine kinase